MCTCAKLQDGKLKAERKNILSTELLKIHLKILSFDFVCRKVSNHCSFKTNIDYLPMEELNKIDWAVTLDGMDLLHSLGCFADQYPN